MELHEKINQIRKLKGITIDELCEKSNIPKGTLSKITAGITKDPKIDTVIAIAKALGCTLDDFDDKVIPMFNQDEKLLIDRYRKLDIIAKSTVENVINFEYKQSIKRIEKSNHKEEFADEVSIIRFPIPYYDTPVSAGTGQPLDYSTCEIMELEYAPPKGTSFIVRVSGDSMEPTISDGDKLFIGKQNHIDLGEIGLFVIQGDVYVKECTADGLKSHNSNYKIMPGDENINVIGKVLGKI